MSDNLYLRDLRDGEDLDIWRMGLPSSADTNAGRGQRRKVDFNVGQRPTDSSASSLMTSRSNNETIARGMATDMSEPEIKLALVVLDSVNAFSQHFLTHPLVVMRRQTQVNRKSRSYHLTPFTVVGFMVRLQSSQGFAVLWKGITSVFITKAIHIGIESVLCELTPCVRDLSGKRVNIESVFQHLALKSIAIVLVTPFLCSSCAETVQSSVASESPGVFDSIKEGFCRVLIWRIHDRKLPIWLICGPTLAYHLSQYLIASGVSKVLRSLSNDTDLNDSENVSKYKTKYRELVSSFWGHLIADVMLFPLSTVITRLYLQGTRTIIDSVEKSNAVTPIISDYDSTGDCFTSIVKEEGRAGLFKGFGALVLQYAIHYSLLRLTNYCLRKSISGLNCKRL